MRRPLTEADTLPITAELLDYARYESNLTGVGYWPLLSGAYSREDRALPPEYESAGARARLAMLTDVAKEIGASPNQIVLRWMMDADPPILPLFGVSSGQPRS